MSIKRPCLWCGRLGAGSRCDECETKNKRIQRLRQSARPKPDRPHYKGNYKKRAKQVRDNAERCWICGGGPREHDPWTADHVVPADPESLLLAAHKSCNSRRGNRLVSGRKNG